MRGGPPAEPSWFAGLLAGVDLAFAVTGAGTPGWADPHPDRRPREEEYSRVADPGKYRILGARVDAWAATLEDRGIATTRDLPPDERSWIGAARPPEQHTRVRRFEPVRPGALGLVLAGTLVEGAPFGVDVVVADAVGAALIDSVPDCGCDACDSGSADLLEVLDGWVLTVARGGVVHARYGEYRTSRTRDGHQAHGLELSWAQGTWLEESVPSPAGVRRWAGVPWL